MELVLELQLTSFQFCFSGLQTISLKLILIQKCGNTKQNWIKGGASIGIYAHNHDHCSMTNVYNGSPIMGLDKVLYKIYLSYATEPRVL